MRKLALAIAMVCAMAAGLTGARAQAVYVPIYTLPEGQAPAAVGDYHNIGRIAVLSAAGLTLHLENVHFWAPTWKHLDVSAWQLDSEIEGTIKRVLAGRFSFVDIPFDRAKLAAANATYFGDHLNDFIKTVPNAGIDAFLVVRPLPGPTLVSGYACAGGDGCHEEIWMNYDIELIDALSYKVLAKSYARLQFGDYPNRPVDSAFELDDNFALDDARLEKLHGVVRTMFDRSLLETLRSLRSGADLPPMGDTFAVTLPGNAPPPNVKSIALVSALGDTLDIDDDGGLWRPTQRSSAALPDWQIDAAVEDLMRKSLRPGYAVQSAPVDRAVLAKGGVVLGDKGASVPGLPADGGVDAYLVALKIGSEANWPSALRLWKFKGWVAQNPTYLAASYALLLVDAKTHAVLSGTVATLGDGSSFPATDVDDDYVPKPGATLAPRDAADLRKKLQAILADSVPATLARIGMAGPPTDPHK